MAGVRMSVDDCSCIELWHEHPDAPLGSVPHRRNDGRMAHWVRLVDMVDRVACPFGDFEIVGDPAILVKRSDGLAAS